MPNLKTPVTTTEQAIAYRSHILSSLEVFPLLIDLVCKKSFPDPDCFQRKFQPLMTLYLTDSTTPEELHKAQ